jgi:starch synthase
MRVALLTREYPPDVYGGAGVHVSYLARELAGLTDLEVHCFGERRPAERDRKVVAYPPWAALAGPGPHVGALRAISVDLAMAASLCDVDVVHSHTWYTNFGGHLAKLLHGVPHVATVHSLEPLRPWKASQLGAGYGISCFAERVALESADAVVAVSKAMAADVHRCYPGVDPQRVVVIPNAVDPDEFTPCAGTDVLDRYGIDPDVPIVACVARITAQKGLGHFSTPPTISFPRSRWCCGPVRRIRRPRPGCFGPGSLRSPPRDATSFGSKTRSTAGSWRSC